LKYDLSEYLTLTFDQSSVKDVDKELIQKFSENQIKTPSKKIDSETKIITDTIKIDTDVKVELDSKKNKQDKILKPKPELQVNKYEVLLNSLQLTNLGKKVKHNKKVFFIHLQTKNTLHSHTVKYKNKDLQEVTCFKQRDSNDYFTILLESRLKPNQQNKNSESSKDYIKKDEDIILLHHETQKAVHLDTSSKSATTKQSLISARKLDTNNEGFIWKFNIAYSPYGDDYIRSGVIVRIENHNIKLHSHRLNLDGGSGQQEVTGFSGKEDNNLWVVNLPLKTKNDK
jgi:dolichyl-phosphate-mannose--protein O-mannosyl transferase